MKNPYICFYIYLNWCRWAIKKGRANPACVEMFDGFTSRAGLASGFGGRNIMIQFRQPKVALPSIVSAPSSAQRAPLATHRLQAAWILKVTNWTA